LTTISCCEFEKSEGCHHIRWR